MKWLVCLCVVVVPIISVCGLNNGVGLTPPMGFSSWNAFSSNVTEDKMRQIVKILIETGLAAKGYRYINVDEGWLKARDPQTLAIVEDTKKFPSGMKAFGDWVHSQEVCPGCREYLKYGLYTSRGTCQCSEWDYSAVGSQGYEVLDVEWMVNAGADYLKVDSCCSADTDHAKSFADYAKFRDALNATSKPVYFSLCGWHEWYAPPDATLNYTGGSSLGNQWRIAGDGDTWAALTNCINVMSRVYQYAGPGGWNDPDLLIGPNCVADDSYSTDIQARTQVNLWSVMAAPLIISNNLIEASQYNIESYGNVEVIAINQDPIGTPGFRMLGSDLTYPCTGTGNTCVNIWGRHLANGDFAMTFVNNGPVNTTTRVICDTNCFKQMSFSSSNITSLVVRDLWTHLETPIKPPYTFGATVDGDGASTIYRIRPVFHTGEKDMEEEQDVYSSSD